MNINNGNKLIAKVSKFYLDKFEIPMINSYYRQVNILSKLNHPTILSFIGYNFTNFRAKLKPVILMDYSLDKTLYDILFEKDDSNNIIFNDTQKLIITYGIASGMAFLHSHNILHCNLSAENIFFDDFFHLKITGFDYSIEIPQNLNENEPLKESSIKGDYRYLAPEILSNLEYSKASDVYAFAIIIYQLYSNIKIFENYGCIINKFIEHILKNGERPKFDKTINESIQKLIQRCWSQDRTLRPAFEEIKYELKTNPEFITENINKDEFYKYIKYIDEASTSFDPTKNTINMDDLLKMRELPFNKNDLIDEMNQQTIYLGNDINLTKINPKPSRFQNNNYTIYEIIIDNRYYAQVYHKEINNFYRNEIINLCRKINIISQINHPSILNFVGYSLTDFVGKPKIVILTEYCRYVSGLYYHDLFYFSPTKKLIIIYGIAFAMKFLHSHNILHRDLKIKNILFDENDFPKLTMFDISKEIDDGITDKKIKGTPAYLAPEIYKNKEYSKASDVYSFAFIIYEIFTGNKPFEEYLSPSEIRQRVLYENQRGTFQEPINEHYRTLIERCWSPNPSSRPTFDEILNELKTTKFINDEIDKKMFFEYVEFLNEYPTTFDKNRRIKQFDDILSSKIHTFHVNKSYAGLMDMYETETNDLYFEYNYFNFTDFDFEFESIYKGVFYDVNTIKNDKTNEKYVMKHLINLIKDLSKGEIINFSNEIKIWPQLNHPSILKFIGYNPNYSIYGYSIIVEYSPNGSLFEYMKKNEIDDTKRLIIIYGIASAMKFLHSHDILHRDLKISNVLLDEMLRPKLSGFNISIKMKSKIKEKTDRIIGTPAYLAPEIYKNKEYSKASDVYSFAFIIYELFTGNKPFDEYLSPTEIRQKVLYENQRGTFQEPINEHYRTLIERCWSPNPSSRPTFDEILNELETNQNFISEKVNRKEYQDYINMINQSNISIEPSKSILQIENVINSQIFDFIDNNIKINVRNIYETELNDVLFNYKYININNFQKQKLIDICDYWKKYKITDKKSGKTYFAHKFTNLYNRTKTLKIINNILSVNHPTFISFIGFSQFDFKNRAYPVIITENVSDESLEKILEIEGQYKTLISETKKLIIIYGIAAGMSYLHSNNFTCNLDTSIIFLDDFLFPKISINEELESLPEKPKKIKRRKDQDVYSFACITYEIITNEKIYSSNKKQVPSCYQKLIEKCISEERPSFEEIIYHLKTNPDFINENIDKKEYFNYIEFLEKAQSTPSIKHIEDFIKTTNKTFRNVKIDFKKIRKSSRIPFSVNVGSIDLHNYEKEEKLGSGSFGIVYKVNEKGTNNLYAAKVSIYEIDQCENDRIVNLTREIEIISQLNHPSVLKYIGFSPTNFKNKPKPVILTEFASNKSLDKNLELERNMQGNHDWNDTKKLINIYGIASGMAYLHKHNILHRDLKPGNILLDDYLFPKIADFGMSKILTEDDVLESKRSKPQTSGFKGTLAYCAPEVMTTEIYTKKGDVYSFGMIVYEIITNETPYKGLNQFQLMVKLIKDYRPEFTYSIPYSYRKLIEKCWSQNDSSRPDFDRIVEMLENDKSFITKNVDEEEYLNYISFVREEEENSLNHPNILKLSDNFNKVSFKNEELYEKSMKEDDEKQVFSNKLFLDLTKYERFSIISKGDFYKLYQFREIATGTIYCGQMSMMKIKDFKEDELDKFSKELEVIKEMKHPCLLKFIGYSPIDFKKQRKPVIVTEFPLNGSLEDILNLERENKKIDGWDDTKKLINIYGIASGMAYLHSHDILHKSLKPSSIYLDEFLTPKIGDFGLSSSFISSDSITLQSISGIKAAPIYSSPEVLRYNEYSKFSDVYSFSLIVYELVNNRIPFCEIANKNQILNEVVENEYRPEISKNVPESYIKLIEQCWTQEPNKRPTFDEIIYKLKMDSGFITSKVNKENFLKYISIIDSQLISQNDNKKIVEKYNSDTSLIQDSDKKKYFESLENLAKKYSIENDTENIYKYFNLLINSGNYTIPLEYACNLYNMKLYEQSFKYFMLISKKNHPIANFYIGIMKFCGKGCDKNLDESYKILKHLSNNGIDRATEFLEEHFETY